MTDALGALRERRSSSGLFLDFDGTLAEIVARPEEARPAGGAVEVLRALAAEFRVVAVVSGRRAVGLAQRLDSPPGVRCYGLYGLEDESGPLDPAAARYLEDLDGVLPELERAAAAVPGVWVEPKGFHASIHYRAAADPDAARAALLASLAPVIAGAGLRLLEGKRVVEVAPERGPSKGDVVERVAREEPLGGVLYAGDDLPDLDGFAAVARLRADGIAGIRIAVRSGGTPAAVVEAADLVVGGPPALVTLLESLLSGR